jgi:16S rRNA (cytosine967-C5)-methyltransferase
MEPSKETSVGNGRSIYAQSHLRSASAILNSYHGNEPFHSYLKTYFSKNKKHGSKDRKLITTFCYDYFRLGQAVSNLPVEERILLGFFLCENKPSEVLSFLKPGWNDVIEKSLGEKLNFISGKINFNISDIFPLAGELSENIDATDFNLSFLIQPKLYLRIRPGKQKAVAMKLKNAGFVPERISENAVALPNGSKIEGVIHFDKDAVVQDISSQRVGDLMKIPLSKKQSANKTTVLNVWDCCAASGGKSILAVDINNSILLTVSDKRRTALENCKQRFQRAGISFYRAFVADLTLKNFEFPRTEPESIFEQSAPAKFDLVIADVPCTGSGTWSRTPEQLRYFDRTEIERYSTLQKQILGNVIPTISGGGYLLYITCSVFKKENEEIVNYVRQIFSLTLVRMELLKGYNSQADTLFAALFSIPESSV